MFKRYIYILIALLGVPGMASAQYDPYFSHYFDMETSFNPATVGKLPELHVVGAYAMNFAGFENNPRTMFLSADVPFYALKSYQGAGATMTNDQIGAMTHKRFNAEYAYSFKLLGGQLRAGIQAGMISEGIDFSKMKAEDSNDPVFNGGSDQNGTALDLGAGLYYMHGPWYVGASALHLTAPEVEIGERNTFKVDATYYLTGGYNIQLRNPFLSVKPSFLVRTDGTSYRADVTGRLEYHYDKKFFYGGVTYSPTVSFTVLAGGSFHGIIVGYSYEVYTHTLSMGNGSHELFVGYKTDINLVKKGKNRHQSVRIL